MSACKKGGVHIEQMVKILHEADEAPVAEVAKKHGVSDVTICAWRKRFGKLKAVDVKRLRQIETENARLKKLSAERDLEIEVMMEIAVKNGRRAGASSADRVCKPTRPVLPTSLRADVSRKVDPALRITLDQARRADGRGNAGVGGPVPDMAIGASRSFWSARDTG